MLFILFIFIATVFSLFTLLALIEEYIIPKTKPSSKFRKWWRNNIIGSLDEYQDLW
jgi:hypothetical protein